MRFQQLVPLPTLPVLVSAAVFMVPCASLAPAQDAVAVGPPALSDSALVSVLTVLPGDRLYNLFGHTIIRVRDPATDLDVGFNFGTFDFPETATGAAGFVARFAYGQLDYRLAASRNPLYAVDWYWAAEGRPTIEQTLDLTDRQADSLYMLLMNNARPENATYRYDFFFDNCSTRPRDVFETVLGEDLEVEMGDPGQSFRRLLDPYLRANPGVDLSMDIGLGSPADRQATAREALFLPVELMRWLDAATVVGVEGDRRPLVSRTDTLTWAPGADDSGRALPWPSILAWSIAALLFGLTLVDRNANRAPRRWVDGTLFTAAGVAGLVLFFLVFVSLHTVTDRNLNLLWALPTHLVAGGSLLAGRQPAWLRPYMILTLALAVVFLIGLPFWTQDIPAAVIPLVLGIAARASLLALPPESRTDSSVPAGSPASQRSHAPDARSR
jgi:hypothetical protein